MICNSDNPRFHTTSNVGLNNVTVAVSLKDMVPLLMHASRTNRNWLDDFSEDVVEVTQDLYEVLVAYRSLVVKKAA